MTDAAASSIALLGPAIEAARAALRRLDDKDVPAALRKVAGYSGGRLPPPLARKLVAALDEHAWLREKALEEWPKADPDAAHPAAAASALFVMRPAGWWVGIGSLASARASDESVGVMEGLRQELRRAEHARDESKKRERKVQQESQRAAAEAKRDVERARKEARAGRKAEAASEKSTGASLEMAERRAKEAEQAARDAQEEAVAARHAFRRTRKARAELERKLAGAGGGAAARPSPLELARSLDAIAAGARPLVTEPAAAPATQEGGWSLPPGLRPDDMGAIDWLIAQDRPFTLIVDGYNVSFHLSGDEFATAVARRRLNQELARVPARAAAAVRVIVVYDSAQAGNREITAAGRGVEVVFAAEDRIADEEIVDLVRELEGPVVVVSTDREVRDNADGSGALTVWGDALVQWLRRAG